MGIFGKGKERDKGQSPLIIVGRGYSYVRKWWVKWMELATGEMSRANLIVLTVIFVGFGSIYYVVIIVRAFTGDSIEKVKMNRIKLPEQATSTGEPYLNAVPSLDSINVKQLKREGNGEEGKNSKND
ncbi:hypothetical protein [Flavobacterium cerinum]|uniref:DUF3989 domain-containing protein n=1 Tax=Flavobacterium cerinum TaxID=2502784 RepID=A0ABY5IMY0_9FLAO|nr:hypothetical protein [Flavobacterium cerinum]UUC44205.1 hypothetical protein NOX80_11230 [Flavobacterium cerinum]